MDGAEDVLKEGEQGTEQRLGSCLEKISGGFDNFTNSIDIHKGRTFHTSISRHLREGSWQILTYTEMRLNLCTWFGEISSCSC